MTKPDTSNPGISIRQRYLEIAIPVLSFGSTLVGILFWNAGFALNYSVFSAGCVIGSCILAYLAWIRPRKDIVALMTPVYSFLFAFAPSEGISWLVLQLLYAASLTILLFRLKKRFGSSAKTLAVNDRSLDPRVIAYIERLDGMFGTVTPEHARAIGEVFIRFARGDYRQAARLAVDARTGLEGTEGVAPLTRALAIAEEQALHLENAVDGPVTYLAFEPVHAVVLAKEDLPGIDRNRHCQLTLDNALLLLFGAAWIRSPHNRDLLRSFEDFVVKLIAD